MTGANATGTGATGINQTFAYNASGDRIEKNDALQQRQQEVTYNSQMRPVTLAEGGNTATFLYDASGNRKKMTVTQGDNVTQTKYYLGDRYETDDTKTSLYINGNAYSSPIVYVKESGQWKIYYICRDYLGSITHLANADGSLAQELSYDAWGRLRNPATQAVYGASEQPVLKLGRGYTGHEHLSLFGLVNMNARLYDPVLGRFLSPDPYVQMPDNLQNLNRYSYCLNNPLAYVDESGELFGIDDLFIIGGALIGAYLGASLKSKSFNPKHWDGNWWKDAIVGGVVGAITGGVIGSMWASGATISIGLNIAGLKTVPLIVFNPATASSGGVATATIGGTLFGGGVTFSLGKDKDKDNVNRDHYENTDKELPAGKEYAVDLLDHYVFEGEKTYHISSDRLYDMFNKAQKVDALNWKAAEYIGNNTYKVPVNFYKTDYYYSFGSAEMTIYKDALTIKPIGFNDTWDLDFKGKNGRSKKAETVTRAMYGVFGGKDYKIVYP